MNLLAEYMAALADHIARQRMKATHPDTRTADAHDILCTIGGADFALRLAQEFMADATESRTT